MSLAPISLENWVRQRLETINAMDCPSPLTLSPLAGDAGSRQYYRLNTQPPLLVVTAPPTQAKGDSMSYFAELAGQLREFGVAAPNVLAVDHDTNTLLIECFDGSDLLDVLNDATVDGLYGEALMTLLCLQQIPLSAIPLPAYDEALLKQEMSLFQTWFIEGLLGYTVSAQERRMIETALDFLVKEALSQPQVVVHRDYHSRNLIHRDGEPLGVIDFQDAVYGPITYDVVSLLRDCYVRWSPEKVRQWALGYGNMAVELDLLPTTSAHQFLRWFDTMGLQRHIKVLGIFARLYLRDNKPRYLDDLPLVLRYTLEVAEQYSETQALAGWMRTQLLPIIQQQSWYQDITTAGEPS